MSATVSNAGSNLLPSHDPNNNGTSITDDTILSGTDLYCYECDESYDSTFDPSQAPCLNNLSQITIRKCSIADNYCTVCCLWNSFHCNVISCNVKSHNFNVACLNLFISVSRPYLCSTFKAAQRHTKLCNKRHLSRQFFT